MNKVIVLFHLKKFFPVEGGKRFLSFSYGYIIHTFILETMVR